MAQMVTLQINGTVYPVGLDSINSHTIREDDSLSVAITVDDLSVKPTLYFEDAEPELSLVTEAVGLVYRIPVERYFAECFGHSWVRIYVDGQMYSVFFNVRAKKVSADAAAKMIRYLAAQHESLIRSCLSRSTMPVGSHGDGVADPESIIGAAEAYVASLLNLRSELLATKRTRLVSTRQPLWKSSRMNCDIDPLDILSNLDAISLTQSEGDLFLRGRHFMLGDIDVSALQETSNVHENQILLGGLYSIRSKILSLIDGFDQRTLSPSNGDGYESFDYLMLTITSAGMVRRCCEVFDKSVELVRFFESRMGVSYAGEIRPVMTPYARTSRVYRALYAALDKWYSLGAPSFGANQFLTKLKSLSKIYELYTLFHMINHMLREGWEFVSYKRHPELGDYVPQEIILKQQDVVASLAYEPEINLFQLRRAEHNDLVDVAHSTHAKAYNYWTPDFVFRLDNASGSVKYLILDAKYSTENSVQTYRLPDIVEKYYWGMACYDAKRNCYSNDPISAVVAIYPLGVRSSFMGYGKRKTVGSHEYPLPIMGAVGLTIEGEDTFTRTMVEIFNKVIGSMK